MLFVESIRVDEDHLQESIRQILHREREEVSDRAENFLALAAGVGKRDEAHAPGEIGAPEEILIAARNIAEILIGLEILNIRLNERRVILHGGVEPILVGDDAINRFVHGTRPLVGGLRSSGTGKRGHAACE